MNYKYILNHREKSQVEVLVVLVLLVFRWEKISRKKTTRRKRKNYARQLVRPDSPPGLPAQRAEAAPASPSTVASPPFPPLAPFHHRVSHTPTARPHLFRVF